jgi:RNA polymerase primary sigma factor
MTNEELVQEYQNGNKEALDELMQQNTGLVMYFANKYKGFCSNASLDFDDLVQEGWIGLMNAAEKYNPTQPLEVDPDEEDEDKTNRVSFTTYAGYSIKGRILRSINKNIPRVKKSDTYSEAIMVNSINELLPGADDTTLEAMIPDDKSKVSFDDVDFNIDNQILRMDLLHLLDSVFGGKFKYTGHNLNGVENVISLFDKLLDGITPKEVLLLHYGLFGKAMTHREIGQAVRVSASRIEQIEFKGLYAIRNHPKCKEFMEKYEIQYVQELKQRKDNMNMLVSPGNVVIGIELIDDLLKKYIAVDEE